MKTIERLPDLSNRLGLAEDPAALKELGEFLHQVVHDLNNPLGTFGMEFYSLGLMAQQLEAAASAGDLEQVRETAAELAEIQQNLVAAHGNAVAILEAMDSCSASLSGGERREGS